MSSLLLLLAAVLLSPKIIYCTTDRCWDSEAGAGSQRDWIRKQKCQKNIKIKKEGRALPKQVTWLHTITHTSLHRESRGSLNPHSRCQAVCFGHSWKLLRLYAEEHAIGNHRELHHTNPSGDSDQKKAAPAGKRALKSSLLRTTVTLILKHKVLTFLMLSHEGSSWTGGVPDFHASPHTVYQRLWLPWKYEPYVLKRNSNAYQHEVVNFTNALATSKKGWDRIYLFYMTRGLKSLSLPM